MTYRRIEDRLWNDPKVRGLSPDAKLAFLYAITRPKAHVSGIDYLLDAVAVHETGLPAGRWKAALGELEVAELVEREGDLLWVRNLLRYQGSGPKVMAAVKEHLKGLHERPIVLRYLEETKGLEELLDTLSDKVSLGVSHTPSAPVPVPVVVGRGGGRARARRPAIPAELLALEWFESAWEKRLKAARKRPTETAEATQLERAVDYLASEGEDFLWRLVEDATAGGWQGFDKRWASPAKDRKGAPSRYEQELTAQWNQYHHLNRTEET